MAKDANAVQFGRDIAARLAPYSASNALPANTVAWDGTWGGGWVDVGYTSGGLHFQTDVTRTPVVVDQELDPIALVGTARTATMRTNLSQFDLDNIVTATGQGAVTTLAPTTGAAGYDQWDMGSDISDDTFALGFDFQGRDGMPIRFAGWNCIPNGGMTLDMVKDSATGLLIPLDMRLTPDSATSPARLATIRDVTPHI